MSLPLTLVAGRGRLVGRPTGVAHIYSGSMTRSGRMVPTAGRPACRLATRRLYLLPLDGPALTPASRPICTRCLARLTKAAARTASLQSRGEFIAAYGHLEPCHLIYAAGLATTVADTHRIGMVAQMLFGPAGVWPLHHDEWAALDATIIGRRRALATALRTPEEVEAARRAREIEAYNDELARAGRRRQERVDRIQDRQRRGGYLAPWEREPVAN